jgi:hypothetical protein
VDTGQAQELEGQTSINELLDEPVGAVPIQLVLPIHVQLPSREIRPSVPQVRPNRMARLQTATLTCPQPRSTDA